MSVASNWFVYMLRCADGSLYTGVTTDITRRIEQHNSTRQGAKYTRQRRPVSLVYCEEFLGRAAAQKRECEIKKLDKRSKEAMIEGYSKHTHSAVQ